VFTIHHAHDLRALWLCTLADVTAILIFLEAILTEHCTHDFRALVHRLIAFAHVASIGILHEACLAEHHAHDFWTFDWCNALLLASAQSFKVVGIASTATIHELFTLHTAAVVEPSLHRGSAPAERIQWQVACICSLN
jgi:hypothetical protein